MSKSLDLKLEKVVESYPHLEFVGIINNKGRIENQLSKNEIKLSKKKIEMFCMEIALYERMQRDFDKEFGVVRFNLSERNNRKILTIPKGSDVILAIMRKDADHVHFLDKVNSIETRSSHPPSHSYYSSTSKFIPKLLVNGSRKN